MSYGVAFVLILLIAGWLASGTLVEGGKGPGAGEESIIDILEVQKDGPVHSLFVSLGLIKDPEQAPEPTPEATATPADIPAALQSVRYQHFVAQMMPIEVAVRGQTNANATVSVRAETSGIVKQVHVSKGDHVNPGDPLCTLDEGTRLARKAQGEAALIQAQASLERARADFDTNKALRDKGLAAANTARQFQVNLAVAEAAVRAAESALNDITKDIERTRIVSEISGVVQDPLANVGDMLNVSAICATIVQLNPMLFTGKVAEAKVSEVAIGQQAQVSTVTGQSVAGTVHFVSSIADRSTRAFQIEIELDNSDGKLRDGVTSVARIQVGAIPAHLIPASAMTLDTDGKLGVRTVTDDVAHFVPIQIVGDEANGVWVSGLPEKADIIILGQEFVSDGQRVDAREGTIGSSLANAETPQGATGGDTSS